MLMNVLIFCLYRSTLAWHHSLPDCPTGGAVFETWVCVHREPNVSYTQLFILYLFVLYLCLQKSEMYAKTHWFLNQKLKTKRVSFHILNSSWPYAVWNGLAYLFMKISSKWTKAAEDAATCFSPLLLYVSKRFRSNINTY